MTEPKIPERWLRFASRVRDSRAPADTALIADYTQQVLTGARPRVVPVDFKCPRGHQVIRLALWLPDGYTTVVLGPLAPGKDRVYDVATGSIDDAHTTDNRVRFTCFTCPREDASPDAGDRRPKPQEWVLRYTGLVASTIRVASSLIFAPGRPMLILGKDTARH